MTKIYKAISSQDAEEAFRIIQERCKWLRDKNIEQWRYYTQWYGAEYFKGKTLEGKLYVAKSNNEVIGCIVVNDYDEDYWQNVDQSVALYPKNFATKVGFQGVGKTLEQFLVNLAHKHGKRYLRMDCDRTNPELRKRHESNGWICIEECVEDPEDAHYHAALYQKEV